MCLIRNVRKGIHIRARHVTSRLHFTPASLLALTLLAASASTLAGTLDKVFFFNIEAQPLEKALLQFGAQTSMQLSFAPDSATAALKAPELNGHYTGREALGRLLKGTGLRYVTHRKTIEILPKASLSAHEVLSSSGARQPPLGNVTNRRHIADAIVQDPTENHAKASTVVLQQVVVTGSRLLATSEESPQEVQIYDEQKIQQSGQNSLATFLSTLPAVSLTDSNTIDGTAATVRVRGLPAGTTLVLLNGRRLEVSGIGSGGGTFFDLDDLPLAAIQRIEVDPNGSSAVYGSDAIAGVVNIILKQDFDGFAANANYGWSKDFETLHASVALGKQASWGGISVIGSYDIDGGLLTSQRLLSANNDYRTFGGPDTNMPLCSPGNVFSTNGEPLPGAPAGSAASYAAVTGPTSSGRPGFSQFSYGILNECSFIQGFSVLSPRHRSGVLLEGHIGITGNVKLFSELLYTHLSQEQLQGYPFLFGSSASQSYTVSASNPYNPFGETVGVALKVPEISRSLDYDTDFVRALFGVKGTLADHWQWELSAWQSSDWTKQDLAGFSPDSSAIQSGLDSSDLATALNPFINGPIASQAVLQSLFNENDNTKGMGRDRSAQAFIRGPIFNAPAGSVDGVIGADYIQSTLYENEISTDTITTYKRTYYALFTEARIPIIGAMAGQSGQLLTLTAAGRHDQYSDFGSANTYQFGLDSRPFKGLLLRGTYADAFDAPTLSELYGADTSYQGVVTDPSTGESVATSVVSGGNRSLRPITGHSHTVGVVYSNRTLPGLQLSVTQWNVVEVDVIQSFFNQYIANNPMSFPGRVVRNSAGQIVEIDDTEANFGTINVSGIDYQMDYSLPVGKATWSLELSGTETYRYEQGLVPGAQPIESVSVAQDDGNWAPRWKGIVALGWKKGATAAHLQGRYTGSYQDYDSTRRIGNVWIFDTNIRWSPEKLLGDRNMLRDSYLEVGATNLFNRAPQFSNYFFDYYGFDLSQMSVLGRLLYVNVGVKW